jgi:two-component system chemotaxis response regulator CheB
MAGDSVEQGAAQPALRLLSLDDKVDSPELVARIAGRCGYEARVASTPDAIRTAVRTWKPQLLALDLSMPDLNGIDLLRLLQETGFDGRLLIISGHDDWMRASAGRLAEARGLKVICDMRKPLDTGRLRQVLTDAREGRAEASPEGGQNP